MRAHGVRTNRRIVPTFPAANRFILLPTVLSLVAVTPPVFTQKPLTTPGIVREFTGSLDDVRQAVISVQKDQTVHGTKMFDKEPSLSGAEAVGSSPLFEAWEGPGEVYYKTRADSIAPRHFLDTADIGTVAVRYVVSPVTPDRTRVRVDAVYVEKFRRSAHGSDGTVEKEEMKEIKDTLESMQEAAMQAADARRREKSAELVRQSYLRQHEDEATRLTSLQESERDLQTRITSLRHDLERRVKAPGADLKSAPFRGAANLKTLPASTELIVLIITPHWLGVETPEGQRGWLPIEQLEPLP
jgi:hypothetical protein